MPTDCSDVWFLDMVSREGVKGGKFHLDGEKQIPYLGLAGCWRGRG